MPGVDVVKVSKRRNDRLPICRPDTVTQGAFLKLGCIVTKVPWVVEGRQYLTLQSRLPVWVDESGDDAARRVIGEVSPVGKGVDT